MKPNEFPTFIGVDLGWYAKPSGLAIFQWTSRGLRLCEVTRMRDEKDIRRWFSEFRGAVIALLPVLLERLVDDVLKLRWQVGIQPNGRGGRLSQNRFENYSWTLSTERQRSRRHLVEHNTKQKQIRPCIEFFASHLLRGHIGDSP
jgi:hypothetical protein